MMLNHEDHLVYKSDLTDNAAYALAVALLRVDDMKSDEDILPWDMSIIGSIVDAAEEILQEHGLHPCRPFNDGDDMPCHLGDECENPNCPLKKV